MQTAIMQGIYDVNSPQNFSCPSSECRWNDSYVSLGFKTECKNVTLQTLPEPGEEECDFVDGFTYCNMTTPGGVGITTRFQTYQSATSYYMNATEARRSIDDDENEIHMTSEFMRFAVYRATVHSTVSMRPGNIRNINVTDCSLSLAAYEHKNARSNGTEFTFDEVNELEIGEGHPYPWFRKRETSIFGQLVANVSSSGKIIELRSHLSEFDMLGKFFMSPTFVSQFFDGEVADKNTDFGLAPLLSGNVDLDERFAGMARGMTSYVRSGPNSEVARGKRLDTELFVVIRWYYFLGPVIIEFLSLLLGIITIYFNRGSTNVPLWKSSTLAVLACQYEKELTLLQSTSKDIKEISESAKKAEVSLE